MRLPRKSAKPEFDIQDYYAIKVKSIWGGLKQESPAFWWLCIYLFLEYVRPASLYPVLNVLPWTLLSLMFLTITAFFDKTIRWVENPGNVLFMLFYFLVLVSSVFAFHPAKSLDKIDVVLNWVIVYFLVINILNTEKRFFIFVLLFLLVNFKMSEHGFRGFVARGFSYTRWGVVGPPGWFGDSGDFGIAMLMFTSTASAFALALRQYWGLYKKLFFYLVPVTGLVTVIATSSRGAQLGLVAIGLWVLLKSRQGLKAVFGILIIGSILYTILPDEMLDEYRVAGEDGTSRDRLAHWDFGLDVVLEHPGLGIGYNNWLDYCDYRNPDGFGGAKPWCRLPHNTYISAATEIGVPALILYLSLAVLIFILNARTRVNANRCSNNFIYFMSHGLDVGLFGYLVASIFFTVLFYPLFWLQLAMTVALNNISKKQLVVLCANVDKIDVK